MAFPLAAVATGVSLLGGISGLLGGGRREQEALAAEERAIADLRQAGDQEYSDALSSGQRDLYGLRGTLSDALGKGGRALGAAEAGAGVYNSSAVSGALANEEAANSATVGRFTGGLADTLARIRDATRRQVAGMQYGFAANELNNAREMQAGSAAGLSSMIGQLGQFNLAGSGANAFNPNRYGPALNGSANSALPPINLPRVVPPGMQALGNSMASVGAY